MLFAVLGGLLLGIGVYYLLPSKGRYGAAVLPAVAGAATAAAWAGLTWAGWTFDGGWIWVVALAAGVAASALTGRCSRGSAPPPTSGCSRSSARRGPRLRGQAQVVHPAGVRGDQLGEHRLEPRVIRRGIGGQGRGRPAP